MEFKQLEAYIKVYELRNFSKAAQEMFLSQPSISAYINALEKELQTQLIYRSTKEFQPSKAGKIFYEYAKELLSLRDKSILSLKNLSGGMAGNIDMLASSVPAQYILPEILGIFHKLYPNVVLNVEQMDTAEVIQGISAHKGEIGFVGSKIDNPKCLYREFMSEKLIMIAPYEERFKRIDADDISVLLQEEYFVMREKGSGTRLEYEEYFEKEGMSLNQLKISAYFNNTQSIVHAVANGLGLSIVSELAAGQYIKQKMVLPIPLPSMPQRRFYLVQKKNCSVPALVDVLINFIHTYQAQ